MRGGQKAIKIVPVGVIHTPFNRAEGTPIQPRGAEGAKGTVEVFPQFVRGLRDLEGFERIWLVYWFHRAGRPQMEVVPFMDSVARGLFATRAPCRPNPIGISAVKLIRITGGELAVEDVDMLDGTPLLDIKPYVPDFDCYEVGKCGWLEHAAFGAHPRLADDRFVDGEPQKPLEVER